MVKIHFSHSFSQIGRLGIEIEKITQRLGYAADTVRGWGVKEKE